MISTRLSIVTASRNRSRRNSTRQPSFNSPHPEAGGDTGVAPAGITPTFLGIRSVSIAAADEVPAVIHSTMDPSNRASRLPAAAGPITMINAPRPSLMPMSRCAGMPPFRTIAGRSASRAVIPGTSPTTPTMPKRMSHPRFNPVTRSTTGRAASDVAETRSVITDDVRLLIRSITTPMTRPETKAGTAVAAERTPAERTLPVVCKTIRGRATAVIEFPSNDRAYEAR